MFQHVIARSKATWQSASPAVGHGGKQYFGRIRESAADLPKVVPACRVSLRRRGLPHQCAHWFAMTSLVGMRAAGQWCNVLRLSQGTRIATPVCALVRNDMQKTGRCLRVQGPPPLVIARSEATWQSVTLRQHMAKGNTLGEYGKVLRICPK